MNLSRFNRSIILNIYATCFSTIIPKIKFLFLRKNLVHRMLFRYAQKHTFFTSEFYFFLIPLKILLIL